MDKIKGIVGWRMWHLYSSLTSIRGWTAPSWDYPMRSRGLPEVSNNKGLYAYSFDGDYDLTPKILNENLNEISQSNPEKERAVGIVELRGKILLHSDGTIRAQWAIPLLVWVNKDVTNAHMNKISQAYNCLVVSTDDFIISFNRWKNNEGKELISQNVYKMGCYGESADDILFKPITSRETFHENPQELPIILPKEQKRKSGWFR